MQYCRDEKAIKDLIAYAMATDVITNPEGLPVEVFKERLSQVPLTNELIEQWLEEDVTIPQYWEHNSYSDL